MRVNERETGGKVKMQGAEVVKVDEFKYLVWQWSVHKRGEEDSVGRVGVGGDKCLRGCERER